MVMDDESKSNQLPELPAEIWVHILNFLKRNDLLTFRLVSRQYDNVVIQNSELRNTFIWIKSTDVMCKFFGMILNDVKTTDLRFTKFQLNMELISLNSLEIFLKYVGEDIRELILSLKSQNKKYDFSVKVNICLQALPNLEVLHLHSPDEMLGFNLSFQPLKNLKKLYLDTMTGSFPDTSILSSSTLYKWLQKTPNVEELICETGKLNITDINVVGALQEIPEKIVSSIRSLKIEFHGRPPEDLNSVYHIYFANGFKQILSYQSNFLQKLYITSPSTLRLNFPVMKKLELLKLEDEYHYRPIHFDHVRLSSEDFPNLKKLELPTRANVLGKFSQIREVKFPNVNLFNIYRKNFPNANQICVNCDKLEQLEALKEFPSVYKFEINFEFIEKEPEDFPTDGDEIWKCFTNGSKIGRESPFYIDHVNDEVTQNALNEPREDLQWKCFGINTLTFSKCDEIVVTAIAYLSCRKYFRRQKTLVFNIYNRSSGMIPEEVVRILTENHDKVVMNYRDPDWFYDEGSFSFN